MFSFWKRKNQSESVPPVVEMMDLTIGRTVEIDSLAYSFWPNDCLVKIERPNWLIVSQGFVDLGEGSYLHRFYPADDNSMIQIQGGDGNRDRRIDEVMVWTYYDNSYPETDREWEEFKSRISRRSFNLPNSSAVFERVWFADSNSDAQPVSYWETVFDDKSGKAKRNIFQTAMLFGRTLSDGSDEMLLVNMEETDNGDRSVCYMIGRMLSEANFNS